jgi:hypothetical protein
MIGSQIANLIPGFFFATTYVSNVQMGHANPF